MALCSYESSSTECKCDQMLPKKNIRTELKLKEKKEWKKEKRSGKTLQKHQVKENKQTK
jgi:hypothetical protein